MLAGRGFPPETQNGAYAICALIVVDFHPHLAIWLRSAG
jgi:hypothetical protein